MNSIRNKQAACRDASVECLRCILMFLIVCVHTWGHGVWKEDRSFWTLIFTVFTYWHVPAFVAISGWYGIRFSFTKIFSLWGMFLFYSLLSVLYTFIFNRAEFNVRTCMVYGGWFGGAYMMLLCFSRFANIALDQLAKMPLRDVFMTWGVFVIAFSCHLFPFRALTGISDVTQQSFGFVSLFIVYATMRIIRDKIGACQSLEKVERVFTHGAFFIVLTAYCTLLGIIIAYILGALSYRNGGTFKWETGGFFLFNSPLNWVMGIYIVIWFIKNVHIRGRLATAFRYIAPSMFGIYLLHETTSFGKLLYKPLQYRLSTVVDSPLLIILLTGVSTFVICLCVDMVRRVLVAYLVEYFTMFLRRLKCHRC